MRRATRTITFTGVVALVLLLAWLWPRPKALYTLTFLPSFESPFVLPLAINDRGQIAGYFQIKPGDLHLFLWERQEGARDLGPIDAGRLDMNNAGQIAGTMIDPNGKKQAFLWDPNSGRHPLGTPAGAASQAYAINNLGQVVGSFKLPTGVPHAFLWDCTGGLRDLGLGRAWAINDAGAVVVFGSSGCFLVKTREEPAAAWLTIPLRGMLSINNRGWIAGQLQVSKGQFDEALWHPVSGLHKLMQASSGGNGAINDANQVLVEVTRPARFTVWRRPLIPTRVRCYLRDPVRGLISLDEYVPVGLHENLFATDLNNQGVVVGAIQSQTGPQSRGVLLEPIPECWRKR